MKIDQLHFDRFEIERDYRNNGIHSRVIYFDPQTEKFIKIWNTDFFYHKYFTFVYKYHKQFLMDISILEDIIENNNGDIIGYITPKSKAIHLSVVENDKYTDLINRLTVGSKNNNLLYIDLNTDNVVEIDNIYYIIDLEPIIPIQYLKDIPNIKGVLEFNNYQYMKSMSDVLPSSIFDAYSKCKIVKHQTYHRKNIKYSKDPGRIFLEQQYLADLKGRILFIGTQYYTDFYHRLVDNEDLFETLDVDEKSMYDGSPHKHYICNILDFENQGYLYDHICFFGIIGHPDSWDIITDQNDVRKCISILDRLVAPGGTLLLGPACNHNFDMKWWESIYANAPLNGYSRLKLERIGINYIWHGQKNG